MFDRQWLRVSGEILSISERPLSSSGFVWRYRRVLPLSYRYELLMNTPTLCLSDSISKLWNTLPSFLTSLSPFTHFKMSGCLPKQKKQQKGCVCPGVSLGLCLCWQRLLENFLKISGSFPFLWLSFSFCPSENSESVLHIRSQVHRTARTHTHTHMLV